MGPKTNQDPMNNVFEQKNSWGNFFRTPGTPDRKNFRTPARAGPAGPAGSPKVVKIVPLGSLTLLKRSSALKNNGFEYKYYGEIFCLAIVLPKTCFWAPLGVFGLFWGRLGPTHNLQVAEPPKIQNSKIFLVLRVLTKKNFQASQAS